MGSPEERVRVMVQGQERVGESYIAVLWGSRGWKDVHKVQVNSPETMDNVDQK